jgi:membrane protein
VIGIENLQRLLNRLIWDERLDSGSRWKAVCLRSARICYAVVRDLARGQLTLRATSLVYTTLLALVPLLAVSFSVLKGFGVHNQVEPFLLNFLQPFGDKGVDLAGRIIGFVNNMKVKVLGYVGLGLLMYTVTSMIQKMEGAFNYIWHVRQSRPLTQRFSGYLSVILIGPVLVFSALGVTASLMSTGLVKKFVAMEPFGGILIVATKLLPYLLTVVAFAMTYLLVPNTRVRADAALVGALVSGVLWEATGWVFASFVVKSTQYTAIYSGFAIVITFMIWLYLSWLILLVGASVAFYYQEAGISQTDAREVRLASRQVERLALLVMQLIGWNYYHEHPPWMLASLATRLQVPAEVLRPVVEALERHRLVTRTAAEPPAYLPARPLDATGVVEVFRAVREGHYPLPLSVNRGVSGEGAVEDLVQGVEEAIATTLRDQTLKELALALPPPPRGEKQS